MQAAFSNGTATRAQYDRKRRLIADLVRASGAELRQSMREVREDQAERREDHRERREDRRRGR